MVAGILIALQINNMNSDRQARVRELTYLANIRSDLVENIAAIDRIVADRVEKVAASKRILAHYRGEPVTDWSAFNADAINVFDWQRFYFGNNTYQELVNSGNFATLSNARIKTGLLDSEAL